MTIQAFNYLIESSIVMAVLYALYFLVFRQYKNFLFNRAFLIFSMIFSLIVPVLHISLFTLAPLPAAMDLQQAIQLPEVIITPGDGATATIETITSKSSLLFLAYFAGISLLLSRLLYHFTGLYLFIKRHRHKSIEKGFYRLIPTDGRISTCSFFNYLLWDNSQPYDDKARLLIMAHEETHIRQKHSYDILFAELIMVFFWFNPIVYLYRNSLSTVHEYIADHRAASLTGISQYISLLSLKTLRALNLTLGNNFHQTQILKRMTMLKTEKRRSWWSRMALTLPVFAMLFYVFACETDTASQSGDFTVEGFEGEYTSLNLSELPVELEESFDNFRGEVNLDNVGLIYTPTENLEKLFKTDNYKTWAFHKEKSTNGEMMYAIVEKIPGHKPVAMPDAPIFDKEGNEIYTVVDEHPLPEGGMGEFYQYIMQNLSYPLEARKGGVEGKVFVEFVVDETGKVTDAKVAKGIGSGCDEEALRVVSGSRLWTAGKKDGENVKVKMILPITFKLDSQSEKGSTGNEVQKEAKISSKKMEEVVVVGK